MEDGCAEKRKPWELVTAEPLRYIEKEKRKMEGLQGKLPENITSIITAIRYPARYMLLKYHLRLSVFYPFQIQLDLSLLIIKIEAYIEPVINRPN